MKLIKLINKLLERRTKPRKRAYFYISEAGKTPYELFKSFMQKKKISPRLRRIFDNGNQVHERLRKYFKKLGIMKAEEVRIRNNLFRGRADAILLINNKIAVIEIKSINRRCFERLGNFCPRKTYLQLQLYLHFLKIERGIALFECKDTQRLREYHVWRKPRVALELIRTFSKLKKKFMQEGVMR